MSEILGDRACEKHPECPMPCVQCAGMSLSQADQARGGFRGLQRRFRDIEHPPESDDDDTEEVGVRQSPSAVRDALRAWGIKPHEARA